MISYSAGAVVVDSPFSATINTATLSPDTTYNVAAYAEKSTGGTTNWIGTIYTGELKLGTTMDAYEYQLVPGGVVVSRTAADPFPLTVNYTISGSAGTEGTTWAAPVAVTIPANSASATLPVRWSVPLRRGDGAPRRCTSLGGRGETPHLLGLERRDVPSRRNAGHYTFVYSHPRRYLVECE